MENTVNERIKMLRNSLAISQTEFAHAIGTTPATLSRIEQGHTEPRKSTIQNICKAYNVPITWLVNGVGEMILPGESFDKGPNQSDWKEEAFETQKKYIQNLENQVEFLKSLVTKMVGTPNFHDGIASALGNILGNTVSAAA